MNTIKVGFGKSDITPRKGVELYGYSGYLNRYAGAVREPLSARAMAVDVDGRLMLIISCELCFITREITREVRRLIRTSWDISPERILLQATHTHSGPAVIIESRNSWDAPYSDILPRRIAAAAAAALGSMEEAVMNHAVVPCEGIGTNRVYAKWKYGPEALAADFRPEKPELTDTECHVVTAMAGSRMLGFFSYFGCHPVIGGQFSTYVHGDYPGIATAMLEREIPGAIGLFLQGAEGDINSVRTGLDDAEVLQSLDIISSRYACAVRHGIASAKPLDVDAATSVSREIAFSRRAVPMDELRQLLAAELAVIENPALTDASQDLRWAVLRSRALRYIIAGMESGMSFENKVEIQGMRIGSLALLAAPLEIFHAIKEDVVAAARAPIPLVLSLANDQQGYAPDRITAENPDEYAARTVPLWKHTLPYKNIHEELVSALCGLDEIMDAG